MNRWTILISRWVGRALLGALAVAIAPRVNALDVGGRAMTTDGQAVAGVMISVQNNLSGSNGEPFTRTVFSGVDGQFQVRFGDQARSADLSLQASKLGYVVAEQQRRDEAGRLMVDFSLRPTDNVAEQVPPSAWLASFPLDDRDARFVVGQCAGCHQFPDAKVQRFATALGPLGSGAERAQIVKLHEQAWRASVQYMRVMTFYYAPGTSARWGIDDRSPDFAKLLTPEGGLFNAAEETAAATALVKHLALDFSHFALADYPPAATPLALSVKGEIWEFELRTSGWTREVATTPGSAYAWIVEDSADRLGRLNPKTAEIKWIPLPDSATSAQGPHTINADRDGNLWISLEESYAVAKFKPADESWQIYPGFGKGAIAHDTCLDHERFVKFDYQGHLWLTLIGENKLAELDLASGTIHKYDMPYKAGETPFHAALYGCTMASDGKTLWFSQLNGVVGGFNLETKQLETVMDLPFGTIPHRFSIDDRDVIYVALSGDGQLLVYDTRARKELPRLDLPDRNSAPYATTWDPKRRVVWVAASNTDAIYRIDPANGAAAVVPLPRKRTYLRMVDIDRSTGDLWTTYAPLPIGRGPNYAVRIHPGDEGLNPDRVAAGD